MQIHFALNMLPSFDFFDFSIIAIGVAQNVIGVVPLCNRHFTHIVITGEYQLFGKTKTSYTMILYFSQKLNMSFNITYRNFDFQRLRRLTFPPL